MSLRESCLSCRKYATCCKVCRKLKAELAAIDGWLREALITPKVEDVEEGEKAKKTDGSDLPIKGIDRDESGALVTSSIWPNYRQVIWTLAEYQETVRSILKIYSDLLFPNKARDRAERQYFQHFLKCMTTEKLAELAGMTKEGMRKQLLGVLTKLQKHLLEQFQENSSKSASSPRTDLRKIFSGKPIDKREAQSFTGFKRRLILIKSWDDMSGVTE